MTILDRFEGDDAFIETDEGMIRAPRSSIEPSAREGDVLLPGLAEGSWIVDAEGTRQRKMEMEQAMQRLIRRKP